MNNDSPNITVIRDFLQTLREEDLYEPLRDLFILKGYKTWITHGSHELGKDLIATNGEYNILINVKKGRIDQARWSSDVQPSLTELMQTPIIHTEVNKALPKKPLLVFNDVMTTPVDQKMDHFNQFYRDKGEPEVEIWDINRLTMELNEYLFGANLLNQSYLEDISRLILSINEHFTDKTIVMQFIEKHLNINKNFSHFKLAFIYVQRRSELKNNLHAFFDFAEYALVRIWYQIFKSGNYLLIKLFDELHILYIDSLKKWVIDRVEIMDNVSGLFDKFHGGLSEIVAYPLRTFDAIRYVSYLSYFFFIQNRKKEGIHYSKTLLNIIKNNKSSSSPLCEFHYNDIGIALTVLHLAEMDDEARMWLFNLMDFLTSHYSFGYELLSLGGKMEDIFKVIFEKRVQNMSKSYVIPLILDFATILKAEEIFETYRNSFMHFEDILYELIMPTEINEVEIYEREYLNSTEIKLPMLQYFHSWKKNYETRVDHWKRNFSPIIHQRPYVLSLIASVYRDRFFQDVWRPYLCTN